MILGFDKRKATNVPEWLEIATEGIAADGKQRIAQEIEAHYADAVAALRGKGEPEEAAQVRALGDLGNPQDAAKKFRKEYLTEEDIKLLEDLYKNSLRPWQRGHYKWGPLLFAAILLPWWFLSGESAGVGFLPPSPGRDRILLLVIWATFVIIGPLTGHFVARYSTINAAKRRLLYLSFLIYFAAGLLGCFLSSCQFGLSMLAGFCTYYCLRRKILRIVQRSKEGDGETPLAA